MSSKAKIGKAMKSRREASRSKTPSASHTSSVSSRVNKTKNGPTLSSSSSSSAPRKGSNSSKTLKSSSREKAPLRGKASTADFPTAAEAGSEEKSTSSSSSSSSSSKEKSNSGSGSRAITGIYNPLYNPDPINGISNSSENFFGEIGGFPFCRKRRTQSRERHSPNSNSNSNHAATSSANFLLIFLAWFLFGIGTQFLLLKSSEWFPKNVITKMFRFPSLEKSKNNFPKNLAITSAEKSLEEAFDERFLETKKIRVRWHSHSHSEASVSEGSEENNESESVFSSEVETILTQCSAKIWTGRSQKQEQEAVDLERFLYWGMRRQVEEEREEEREFATYEFPSEDNFEMSSSLFELGAAKAEDSSDKGTKKSNKKKNSNCLGCGSEGVIVNNVEIKIEIIDIPAFEKLAEENHVDADAVRGSNTDDLAVLDVTKQSFKESNSRTVTVLL